MMMGCVINKTTPSLKELLAAHITTGNNYWYFSTSARSEMFMVSCQEEDLGQKYGGLICRPYIGYSRSPLFTNELGQSDSHEEN